MLQLGLSSWKPMLTALLLPPVPLLLLMLAGGAVLRRRSVWGWTLLLTGAAGIWASSTAAMGDALQRELLRPARALGEQELQSLRSARRAETAIVVLGGGREIYAPEYGSASLSKLSLQRLRYGLWLARETGLPLAFAGGTGHAQAEGPAEADIAARIAAREFGRPLKWLDTGSRDTRGNAEAAVSLLRAAGITRIVLVTHGWHLRRSQRAFEAAIARSGGGIALLPAPMGLAADESVAPLRWLPSSAGFEDTRNALREYLGLLAGA